MIRSQVLEAIKRLADKNGGVAPGRMMFERDTGIRQSDWYPHLWLRWSDALTEAGFSARTLKTAIPEEVVIGNYVELARALGHLPVAGEIKREAKTNKTFPSHTVFGRFGGKEKLLERVLAYCRQHVGNDDIAALIESHPPFPARDDDPTVPKVATGFVYLMKSGRHYKIGRTNSLGSRARQLTIKIPIPPKTIRAIETDDPSGVEAYWHSRFESKRGEGEWFDLSPDDIKAFKRWKRIA